MKKEYRSFKDAKKFMCSLKLKNQKEWTEYRKSGNKPDDIPHNPEKTYKNEGWKNLGDWLGTGNIASHLLKYRSFKDAKKFVHSLNLKGGTDWVQYCKSGNKPNDIPSHPNATYKNKGWISWGDFFGTGSIAPQDFQFRTFADARKFIHSLNLKGRTDWVQYCKSGNKPNDIPSHPNGTYKNKGWISWGDFFGTGTVAPQNKQFRTFADARKFVQTLGLKGQKEWDQYCASGEKPNDIPSNPNQNYKNKEWKSMGDWLGTGTVAFKDKQYRSFADARKFVQTLGLKGHGDWKKYCVSGNKPDDIPSHPWLVYKEWNIERRKK